jgi:hypothetical protein
MRLFLTGWLFLLGLMVHAQSTNDSIFVFVGHIFSQDSVPVENAHLINYRNTKIVTTDSTGRFSMFAQRRDSLMINHLSLQPKVIHVKRGKAASNHFYVNYRIYQLPTIASSNYDRDYHHFEQNMKKLYADLERLGLRNPNYVPRRSTENPYNPDKTSLGLTTTLGDVLRLFKQK